MPRVEWVLSHAENKRTYNVKARMPVHKSFLVLDESWLSLNESCLRLNESCLTLNVRTDNVRLTATSHCNNDCNILQQWLQHTATMTATYCNTLQRTDNVRTKMLMLTMFGSLGFSYATCTHTVCVRVCVCVCDVCMSHGTYVNESCHANEWVVSHIWMNHVTHMKIAWNSWVLICHMCTYCACACACVCHIWMSHATNVNESGHTWKMSHVTHINESCHTYKNMSELSDSHVPHVQILCVVCMRVSRINESCHTCDWVMLHKWMSHRTHMNESCHTHEISSDLVGSHVHILCAHTCMCHIWMSHVTHVNVNESCHTYEWVMSHLKNESCHTYEWVMTHIWKYVGTRGFAYATCANTVCVRVCVCVTHEWDLSQMWMSQVTHEKWVMSQIWMSLVTHENT